MYKFNGLQVQPVTCSIKKQRKHLLRIWWLQTACICPDRQLSSPLSNLDNGIVVLRHFVLGKDKFVCILSAHRIDKKQLLTLRFGQWQVYLYLVSPSYRQKQLRRRGLVFFKQYDLNMWVFYTPYSSQMKSSNNNIRWWTGCSRAPENSSASCRVSLRSANRWWHINASIITQEAMSLASISGQVVGSVLAI